jgi:hypothetical protein
VLIDAEMTVNWAMGALARDCDGGHWGRLPNGRTRREEWRKEVGDKLSKALDRIANTEARTERGAAIKALTATGGAA